MPAQLSNVVVSRPSGTYDSNTTSLHIFRHTTEQHELSVHSRGKCALWTHLDWKIASGWLVAEDVGWSLEPGGCSFINQVGTVNENTDISLPTLSMITLCCYFFMWGSSRTWWMRESDIHDVFWNSLRGFVHVANRNLNLKMKANISDESQENVCDQNSERRSILTWN